MKVTVLGRSGCHLCGEAVADLRRHLEARPPGSAEVEIIEVDIETDDELHRRYLERIPVIQLGGETVSELCFEAEAFDLALSNLSGSEC